MATVTVSSKGQVVLPAKLRHRLGLEVGARLDVVEEPDGVRLKVVRPVRRADVTQLAGLVTARSRGKLRRLADFDAAALAKGKKP
ncbi:MAG: AbrB/MazE/SpoVT family DNA-binding domain-containing protein [Myxococcales bacterium]|nr:AbrB/MazE/SpoVT family DNA-binding domain-containing protein [Myxococcales bacterium]